MPAEPFVDAGRAGAFLSLPRPLVLKWARSGALKAYPLGTGRKHKWLFRLSELTTELERKTNSPAPLVYGEHDRNYASTSPRRAGKRKNMPRYQQGSVRIEQRSAGPTWVYRWRTLRASDLKRVEQTKALGLVADLGKSVSSAWREVDRQRLKDFVNAGKRIGPQTFGQLAATFLKYRLSQLAPTTASTVRHNLMGYILPRWGDMLVADIEPLDLVAWFDQLRQDGLADGTVAKIRGCMGQVFRYCQRVGLIPRGDESNPVKFAEAPDVTNYRPILMTPEQVMNVIGQLEGSVRILALLSAVTGLRISESLGLKWGDVDFEGQVIHVRRTWIQSKEGRPKTKASAAPVPLAPVLAKAMQQWKATTKYSGPEDWVFASETSHGKRPREGGVAGQDYLRPAAVAAGVIPKGYKGRYGWHNFRHTLAHHLVRSGVGPKVVQGLLRHSKVETTLKLYTQCDPADTLAAQVKMLDDIGLTATIGTKACTGRRNRAAHLEDESY